PVALVVADFDSDGFSDLVSTSASQNLLEIEFGDGTGGFPFFEQLSASVAPAAVLALDLNGDGHPDLVSANRDSGDLSVYLGLGDGSGFFLPADQGSAPRRATRQVGDFTNDGTLDTAVLGRDGRILVRTGVAGKPGAFNSPVVVNAGRTDSLQADQPASDLVKLALNGEPALAALERGSPT